MNEGKKIFSLTALNRSLDRFICVNFAEKLFWVVAEVTRSQEKNGHHYIELADSVEGKTTAEMSATFWFTQYNRINEKLNGILPDIFQNGNKVLILVRIEFHPIFGLKLNIQDVDTSITFGEIEKQKQETIEKLKAEGLFQRQKSLYLPLIAKRIILIGSPNTSGYRDFYSELMNNNIYTNFLIKEIPAAVQGNRAVTELVKAIQKAGEYTADLIVIVRGGGSKMDLNVFNQYEVAKAVCQAKLPIITGIGHESDEVVADLVARKFYITPTAAAKSIYIAIGIFKSNMSTAFDTILKKSMGLLAASKNEFQHVSKYLVHFTQMSLKEHNEFIRKAIHKLQLGGMDVLDNERYRVDLLLNRAGSYGLNYIELKKSTELTVQLDIIQLHAQNLIDKKRVTLINLNDVLNLLNPESLLKKGYTISTIDGIDLYAFKGDLKGAELKTLSNKYLISSTITHVKKNYET